MNWFVGIAERRSFLMEIRTESIVVTIVTLRIDFGGMKKMKTAKLSVLPIKDLNRQNTIPVKS